MLAEAFAFQRTRDRLANSSRLALVGVYAGLSPDDGDWEAIAFARATPILEAASQAVVDATTTYASAVLDAVEAGAGRGLTPMTVAMDEVGDVVVTSRRPYNTYGWRGWEVRVDGTKVDAPVKRFRFYLSEGLSEEEARRKTASYVKSLSDAQLRAVERLTVNNTVGFRKQYLRKDASWLRVTDGDPCGWCRVVADRYYSDEAAMFSAGWHASCGCTWALATRDVEQRVNPGSLSRSEQSELMRSAYA